MDYLRYWSLHRQPFAADDPDFFFAGHPQRAALAGLNEFVNSSPRAALLSAQAGCGLTRLLRHVHGMNGFNDCAAEVILTLGARSDRRQARSDLSRALGCPQTDQPGDEIDRAIAASAPQGVRIVWLIDRCGSAAARLARELVIRHANLSVVAGVTGRRIELDRCAMRIELPSLSLAETRRYLDQGMRHAGARRSPFTNQAIERIQQTTGGVLADIVATAESALALAARNQVDQVGVELIDAIDTARSRAA